MTKALIIEYTFNPSREFGTALAGPLAWPDCMLDANRSAIDFVRPLRHKAGSPSVTCLQLMPKIERMLPSADNSLWKPAGADGAELAVRAPAAQQFLRRDEPQP